MKNEKFCNCLMGAALAFLLAFGTVGSIVTGLSLTVSGMGLLAMACAGAAILSAGCYAFRFGGTVLLCLLTALAGFFWRDAAGAQTLAVLYRMFFLYNSAYGWGIPQFVLGYRDLAPVDAPMAVVGIFVAVAVSWTVCRRKSAALGIAAAALPLFTCFVVTDTVPDSIYLYIWLLGALILTLTSGVRRRNLSQGIRLTAMAAVGATIALALLFWAVPREGYDQHPAELQAKVIAWAQELPAVWEDMGQSGDTGSTVDTLNLRFVGPRQRQNTAVMDVTASESGTLYLRGQDYNTYDGTGWTATRRRIESFPEQSIMANAGEVTVRTRRIRDVVYLPYYPEEPVTLVGGRLENQENRKEYTYSRSGLPDNWRQQVAESERVQEGVYFTFVAEPGNFQTAQRYLVLPKETRVWAQELLENLLTDEKSATAVADTIGDYVRSSAAYDLNTRRMPSEETDFARWFLAESDTGYCVHFATAATVLLRAAGVEARYVEGYLVQAKAGAQVAVRAHQAHAWAEYYEPVLDAWIVLESTPGDFMEGDINQPQQQALPSETIETTPPTLYNVETTPSQPTESAGQDDGEKEPKAPSWLTKAGNRLLGIAAFLAAVMGQRQLRLRARKKRQSRGRVNARALARWQELAYLHRLLKAAPPPELEELAQKAKFSQHSLTAEELALLDAGISRAKLRLQERNLLHRLIDRYIFAAY